MKLPDDPLDRYQLFRSSPWAFLTYCVCLFGSTLFFPVQFHVMGLVFRFRHYLKVFNSVIKRVFINVMNNLTAKKLSSEVRFHHPTVLALRYPILSYHSISVLNPSRMMRSLTERSGISSLLPSTKVLNAITFHVVFGFAFFERALTKWFSHHDEVYCV